MEMIGNEDNQLYCTLTNIHVSGRTSNYVLKDILKDVNHPITKNAS